MKHKIAKTPIFIFAAALLALVFVIVIFPIGVAKAVETLQFEITTDNGVDWSLSLGGEQIKTFAGDFLNPQTQNTASVVFKREIDARLEQSGANQYKLKFKLPSISCETIGNAAFDYTNNSSSGVVFKGIYQSVISTDVREALEYKSADGGTFKNYPLAESLNGGLSFGRGVDVGSYTVRFVVYEIFTFDGKQYEAARYGSDSLCTINKAKPQAPVIETVSVEYGTKAVDIASVLPSDGCRWALSENQSSDKIYPDARLHVREEAYDINFDYIPNDKNYETLKNVSVKVKIAPKTLRITIGDAYSLVGEPQAEFSRYEINTPLLDGDRLEDLGVTLVCEGFDANTAGTYLITARFANADYTPYCLNYTNALLNGGRYMVYAVRKTVLASDGTRFTVSLGEGFRNAYLEITAIDDNRLESGYNLLATYEFIFTDAAGNRIYPDEGFNVTFEGGGTEGASHAATTLNSGAKNGLIKIENGEIFAPRNTVVISFFAKVEEVGHSDAKLIVACKALGGVCCALLAALTITVAVYISRRRYFK